MKEKARSVEGKYDEDVENRRMGVVKDRLGVSFFFFTLVTGPGRSLSLTLSDTRVYEP